MRLRFTVLCGLALIGLQACDRQRTTTAEPSRQMTPKDNDPSFRLSPAQRANAIENIDIDALEKLLRRLPQKDRDVVLQSFLKPAPGASTAQIIGFHGMDDPEIAALLEEVWAPTWQAWGPEAIEKSTFNLPGRALARTRLGLDKKQPPKNR